jgi:hypothetical protein
MVKHYSAFYRVWRSSMTQVIIIICLIIMALMGICQRPAIAEQPPSAVILPFEIFAEQDLTYLQTEIPSALNNALEQAGARVLLLD